MGYSRVTWGLSAAVWLVVIVLGYVMWGMPAGLVALFFGLLPDVSLIGAFSGQQGKLKPSRVRFYNLMHTMYIPMGMVVVGIALFFMTGGYESGIWALAIAGLAWFVHIAADRAFGFGFRDTDGSIIPVK